MKGLRVQDCHEVYKLHGARCAAGICAAALTFTTQRSPGRSSLHVYHTTVDMALFT